MLKIDGDVMSKDKAIAAIKAGSIVDADQSLLPFFLKRTGDIEGWLKSRAIDAHRTNSRLLKKALRLAANDDAALVLKVNAATITDTYWFREEGAGLKFDDVRFKANYFDKLALYGDPDGFNLPYSATPELTNIGSFEKCWRLSDGKWWMIKQGSEPERFSEMFVCKLGEALGFPMAEYYCDNAVIKSPDFTQGASVNYEAAEGLVGDDEDYALNFDVLRELSPDLAEQYMEIIYLDTLCFNMDRHTRNYGILRDVNTGAVLRMAPNYDNNIALISRGMPSDLERTNDRLIALFAELLKQKKEAFEIAKRLPVPDADMIVDCIKQVPIPVDTQAVTRFISSGSRRIQKQLRG